MTSDLWYASSDLPPGRLRVRVITRGRVFLAVRWPHPDTKALTWGEPVKEIIAGQGTVAWFSRGWMPEAWQPEDVARWSWPNGIEPAPLQTPPSRMWAATSRFAAVEEAEAEDLAREMEQDRALARDSHGRSGGDGPVREAQGWRDIYRVTYSGPGTVGREEAESRLCRAVAFDRIIPLDLKRQRINAAVLADLKRWAEVLNADPTEDYRPPFQPAVAEHGSDFVDYFVVMGWLAELYADVDGGWPKAKERVIVEARVLDPPKTWEDIGDSIRLTRAGARKRYDRLLDRLVAVANAGVLPSVEAATRAVQERNRAHKRAG